MHAGVGAHVYMYTQPLILTHIFTDTGGDSRQVATILCTTGERPIKDMEEDNKSLNHNRNSRVACVEEEADISRSTGG